jgi:hypothetical protein
MTLEEFAKDAGCVVQLNAHPEGWNGKWEYYTVSHPHCFFCGYKTEKAAYLGFMHDTFGETATKAIIKLIKKANSKK